MANSSVGALRVGVVGALSLSALVFSTIPAAGQTEGSAGRPNLPPDRQRAVTASGVPRPLTALGQQTTPAPGPNVSVFVRATSPGTVPGGSASFLVTTSNSGTQATASASPTTLTISVPSGMSFGSLTNLGDSGLAGLPGPSGNPASIWSCPGSANGSSQVQCTLTSSTSGSAVPGTIAPGAVVPAIIQLRVGSGFVTTAQGVTRTLGVRLSTPSNGAGSATAARTDIVVLPGTGSGALFPDFSGSQVVVAGQKATESVTLLNLGSGESTGSAAAPVARLSNLLPPTLAGTWQASGTDWVCAGAQRASPTCAYTAGTIAAGRSTSPLTLTYELDTARVAKLRLRPGGKAKVVRWTVGIQGARGPNAPSQSYQNQILVGPPPAAAVQLQASVANGLDELVAGSEPSIDVNLVNGGPGATTGKLAVAGSLPRGIGMSTSLDAAGVSAATAGSQLPWTCATQLPRFVCTPSGPASIPASGSTLLVLHVGLTPAARTGDGLVALQARVPNQAAKLGPPTATVPLFVVPNNVGYPALELRTATSGEALSPVTDGAPATLRTGDRLRERLDITDAGGAPIAPGRVASVNQRFGPGVAIRVQNVPPNERCSTTTGSSPTLTCSIAFTSPLAPRSDLQGPTVVIVPSAPTRRVQNWPAFIRLAGTRPPSGQPLAVQVSVAGRAPRLVTTTAIRRLPTAGGIGRWAVTVSNRGDQITAGGLSLLITLPKGTTGLRASANGWTCSSNATQGDGPVGALCVHGAPLRAGKTLPTVLVRGYVPPSVGGRSWRLSAAVSVGDQAATKGARAALTVTVHRAIRAIIATPRQVVFEDSPMTGSPQQAPATDVPLEGAGSGGNGLGLNFQWRQRCLTPSDTASLGTRCPNQSLRVKWLNQPPGTVHPDTADVSFQAPDVKSTTKLVFQLTVTDGSATSSALATVTVLAPTPASRGFTITNPRPPRPGNQGPTSHTVQLPSPAAPLATPSGQQAAAVRHPTTSARLLADASQTTSPPTTANPSGSTTTTPSSTTPPSSTTTLPPTTTTSEPPSTTTTTVPSSTTTTTTVPSGVSALFCDLVRDAVQPNGFTVDVPGGVSLTVQQVRLSGSGCSPATKIDFSDSKFTLGSVLTGTGLAGTIGADGIHFTDGTLTGPSDWNSPSYSLASGSATAQAGNGNSNLTLTYNDADGLSLSGSVTASGLVFIPLPSGWTSTTTLEFAAGASGTSVTLAAKASGPPRDASPDSPKPDLAIDGSVALDGTFSLSASLKDLVQIRGAAIDLSGSVARASPSAPIATTVTGTLARPVDLVNGLSLTALQVSISPKPGSLGLTGSGAVSITAGSVPFGVAVDLSYQDPKNWSLNATGTGTGTWTPMPGLSISPSDITGSISAENDAFKFSMAFKPTAPWTPKAGVSVANMSLTLGNTCSDSGAPCPKNASLYLTVGGDATFTLPVVGTVTTSLAGALGLPSGDFALVAKLKQPLDLGAGIGIEDAQVQLTRGDTEPTGTAIPASSEGSSGLSVLVHGQVSLPKIGTLPAVDATWSTSGWALAARLGSYSLPGSGGSGTALTDTVVGWASYPTSLNIVDPVTKALTSIALPTNTFEVSGSYDTPDWFKDLLHLPSDVRGRATGSINLSNGDFALRMSIVPGSGWYLYGSAGTATNARLTSVYFEIERKGAAFEISLGGEAALIAPGVSDTDPLQLTVALGYSAATTTVAGTFTLSSASGWQNAFSVNGLTLFGLALTFQINLATLTPSVGLAARAVLPPDIRNPLGMLNGARTTVVANISVTNPCLGIDVDDVSSANRDVINIGKGALTAKEITIEIAPSGCTVGQFHYDPGITVHFDGAILNVPVEVLASLKLAPFSLDAKLDVGDFAVAGVVIDHTKISLAVGPKSLALGFSGGIHVLGTDLTVSGAFSQSGIESNIDLEGKLNNLVLGSALTIKQVTVDVHVVTGLKVKVRADFSASGDIDLLGSTVTGNFRLKVANAQLVEVTAAIKANITVGATNGVNLNGTFNLDYGPSVPFVVDADVALKVGGFDVARTTVLINSSGARLTADFSIGGVVSAKLEGALYSGSPPRGTTITGPNNRQVAAQSGDFLLSARDVTFDLAGFRSTGSISFGRAGGVAWGALGTRIELLGSATRNAIEIGGSFAGNGDFSLSGTGALDLVGFSADITATVAKTGPNVSVKGAARVNVLGSTGQITGEFASNNGSPRFRLNGAINLDLGGYRLTSATVVLSNFPQDAGAQVSVNSRIGSVLTLAGRLTIEGGSRFYLGLNTALDLRVLSPSASVTFTNCVYTYTTNYFVFSIFGYTFRIPYFSNPVCSSAGPAKLDANATVNTGGFSFAVSVQIDSNGNFRATASSPQSGTYTGSTGTLWLAVVAFYVGFSYQMSLTVQSGYPYVSVSGSGSADVYGKTWDIGFWYAGWGGWHHIVGASASITTNPFRVCGSARVWGYSVGPLCL